MTSRRTFLSAGAAMLAGAAIPGIVRAIPLTTAARRTTPNSWFPEPPAAELFQQLALAAMDAARSAGADFADIRIGMERRIGVPQLPFEPSAALTVGYGIRARIQGTWGFQHGSLMNVDAVTSAARGAVAGAARYAAANARLKQRISLELAPAPAMKGEWRGPAEIDPFAVPLDDYYRAMGQITETTARVHQNTSVSCDGLGWRAETRVFASTVGSLVTQRFMRGGPALEGSASLPDNPLDRIGIDLPGLESRSAGFEVVLNAAMTDYLSSGLEEAVRLRELPFRRFMDIGRFPIVFGGAAFGNIIGGTASLALDGDRVSGIEADASGTTFLAPPEEILASATPRFSKLLTVRVDRQLPSVAAVGWDDEGVVPEEYAVIENGRVVDYHTSRETAPLIADWYAKQGRPMRSHGTVVATTPASLPVVGAGHLDVAPASERASVWDLAREIEHGFVIRDGGAGTEPGLTAGMFVGLPVFEIEKGKPVARTSVHIQFATNALLGRNLVALGDASTLRTTTVGTSKGIPWQELNQPVTAPAALCKDVDVMSWVYRP